MILRLFFSSLTALPLIRSFGALFLNSQRDGWRGMLLGICFGAVTMLAIVWWAVLQGQLRENELRLRTAARQQENIGIMFAENLRQVVERGHLISAIAADALEKPSPILSAKFGSLQLIDSAFLDFSIYNRQPKRIFSTQTKADSPPLTRAIEAYNTELRQGRQPGLRAEHHRQLEPAGWQVNLLYPITAADGRHLGVFVATLDLAYLLGQHRDLDFGRSGIIQILTLQGEVLGEARASGITLDPQAADRRLQPARDTSVANDFATMFEEDQDAYLNNFRRIAGTPFMIAVSRARSEVLNDQGLLPPHLFGMLTIISLVLIIGALWMWRLARHQQQLFQSLDEAHQEKRELIERLEEERLRAFQLAAHDHLTGLHNRRMFNEMAAKLLAHGQRQGRRHALFYLDLDRFKSINDSLGHHVGDLLLQQLAGRLSGMLREGDLIARLGGDEFAVLLGDINSREAVAAVARKLIAGVERPYENLADHALHVGTSIGIAMFPDDGVDLDLLCRHADKAMYHAKQSGRGRYCFYNLGLEQGDEASFLIEQSLPHALAKSELQLHFQPKVALDDYRVVGFEALLRWNSPTLGPIAPDRFIPLAERTGQIQPLGRWVIESCCAQLAEWQAAGLPPLPIAFNLSPRQLHETQLPTFIAETLNRFGLPARLLEAEITETCLIEGAETAFQVLNELEQLGIGISLDDFGNGFSNFAYLRILPIGKVKIDRCFVADIRKSTADATIVASMISLAHQLGLEVVAEGVEQREQVAHLRAAGCDEVQGYYFSPPLPADEVQGFLLRRQLAPH